MNTARITALLNIGQLSLDLRAAEHAADTAKRAYHAAWRRFECDYDDPEHCDPDEHRIAQGHEKWFEAIDATKPEFASYQVARRAAYNIKRRWQNACRTAG